MCGGEAADTMAAMLIETPPPAGSGWVCLVGPAPRARGFDVWRLVLAPGQTSDVQVLDLHQLVLALAGNGKLRLDSGPYRFSAPCALEIDAGAEHQFVNLGAQTLELIALRYGSP